MLEMFETFNEQSMCDGKIILRTYADAILCIK